MAERMEELDEVEDLRREHKERVMAQDRARSSNFNGNSAPAGGRNKKKKKKK